MEVQLRTFCNCTTGHPSERELLGQPKKTVESCRRAFLQERSKRNGKNRISRKIIKKMVSDAILTGRAPKMYSSSIRPETIAKYANREKKFDVGGC